jgi:prepilin-type N-terminal cleavage/methylation domain-containing protein
MNRRGFTLIEVLASMALLGTALALFALAEQSARRSVTLQAAHLDAEVDLDLAVNLLVDDLAHSTSDTLKASWVAPADGDASEIELALLEVPSLSPSGDPLASGEDVIRWWLRHRDQGGWRLMREVEPATSSSRSRSRNLVARRALAIQLELASGEATAVVTVESAERLVSTPRPRARTLTRSHRPARGVAGEDGR